MRGWMARVAGWLGGWGGGVVGVEKVVVGGRRASEERETAVCRRRTALTALTPLGPTPGGDGGLLTRMRGHWRDGG